MLLARTSVATISSKRAARHRVDGAVDRLVRDRQRYADHLQVGRYVTRLRRCARDLLWRSVTAQTAEKNAPEW
jgi:hypothetical protein